MLLQKIEYHFSYNADKVAIYSKTEAMTYAQLAISSYNIAKSINQRLAESDSLIAILMNRQPAIIATLLGIMRSGNAYAIVEAGNNHQETMARLNAIQPDFIITDEDNEAFAEESSFRWLNYRAATSDQNDSSMVRLKQLLVSQSIQSLFRSYTPLPN
ncbi:AMP-binding protein [Xenorhabdus entomophaga]|uniref:AMP-binding protein n=1 Tax=Xenorhabdus entomophaga TaxID=3136257 RepID=UPI0030F49576